MQAHCNERSFNRIFGKDITNISNAAVSGLIQYKKSSKEGKVNILKRDIKSKSLFAIRESIVNPKSKDPLNQYTDQILKLIVVAENVQKTLKTENSQKIIQIYDWLIRVHESFKLKEQTLHLAFFYLNEYTQQEKIRIEEYKLVGITALWIASKYEQIYPPRLKNYVIASKNYSASEILEAQSKILLKLNFNLTKTTLHQLLDVAKEFAPDMSSKAMSFCEYIAQMVIITGNILKIHKPSVIVISIIHYSDDICRTKTNFTNLKRIWNINIEEVTSCVEDITSMVEDNRKKGLKSLQNKFSSQKYHQVSNLRINAQ